MKSYPAVKICRLGTDISTKGCGLGSELLYFIKSYFIENNKTGCRFVTVDAYAAAVPFYLKNGFILLTENDRNDPTRLLYFDLRNIADLL